MIPPVVHRIWFGDKPMRRELIEYGKTWERHGYETKLWTEQNLPPLLNQWVYDAIGESTVNVGGGDRELGVWVQRADVVSYELLYRFGGIYANTDMECVRSLGPILGGVDAFAGYENGQFLSNAIMGCEAGNAFFGAVVDEIEPRYREMPGIAMNGVTGPHLLTHVWRLNTDKLAVFPIHYFNPVSYEDMYDEWEPHPDAYTVHHWGHTRGRSTNEPSDEFLDHRYGERGCART